MTPLSSPCSYRQEHIWSFSALSMTCTKRLSFYHLSHFTLWFLCVKRKKDLQMKKVHKDGFGVIQWETFWAALWRPGSSDVAYWVFRQVPWNAMVFCEILWTTTEIQRFMNKVNIWKYKVTLYHFTSVGEATLKLSKLFIIKWLTRTS